jgi:hypothetical protein
VYLTFGTDDGLSLLRGSSGTYALEEFTATNLGEGKIVLSFDLNG